MKLGLALYGGGNQVFYIAGLLKYLLDGGLRFDAICTYSAGGGLLPFVQSNKMQKALHIFRKLVVGNKKNFNVENLVSSQPVFPHDAIYHEAVEQAVGEFSSLNDDEREFKLIVSKFKAPEILVRSIALSSLIFMSLYATKTTTDSRSLMAYRRIFGLQPEVIDLNSIEDKTELVSVIMGASTIYPFIKLRKRHGHYMLDGKLSMLTPIGELRDCTHVLSLHAHYSVAPQRENLIQIFPKRPIECGRFDYVGDRGPTSAFKQGYAEGPHQRALIGDAPFFN